MGLFITAIVFAVIALLIFLFAPKPVVRVDGPDRNSYGDRIKVDKQVSLKPIGYAPLFLAIVFFAFSCLTVVGTRNVGVPTFLNKPTGDTLSAGPHLKAPWVDVTDIDATIKVVEYFGKNAIDVKIGDGGEASVGLSYRWRINPDGADKVFQDYRNSDLGIEKAVRKALVSTNVKAAINEEMGKYDPLANVGELSADMTAEELANIKVNVVPDYVALNKAIQENVEAKIKDVGDLIDIQSITISSVKLPKSTQTRINKFNNSVQNTRNALQEVATKKAQASGNNELAKSLQDPNVLVSKCLDSLSEGEFTPPAGFSCWPGSGSSVVLPAVK